MGPYPRYYLGKVSLDQQKTCTLDFYPRTLLLKVIRSQRGKESQTRIPVFYSGINRITVKYLNVLEGRCKLEQSC